MYHGQRFLGIIPARGGSKRLPGKNILPLKGKPLIEWTINAGKESKYLDVVCVSTEEKDIAEISLQVGAEVPFLRPPELATDSASTIGVVEHCIGFYKNSREAEYDFVVLLQPTSPLRTAADIDSAIKYLIEKKADAVVSVCESEHSPLWSNTLPSDLSMNDFLSGDLLNRRSQELPKYYRLNGAIYIAKTKIFLAEKTFF